MTDALLASFPRVRESKPRPKSFSSFKGQARPNYVADFETTTDPADCRVWAWGLALVDDPEMVEIGTSLDEFIDRISFSDSVVYFHNLKFDGHFILDWLLNNEYEHITNDEPVRNGTIKTLISDMGKFYSMTVKWQNGKSTEFRDSLKKLPMSVRRIALSFKFGETKGDIDYDAPRPINHHLTNEERDYIRRDVSIVAKAMQEVLASGMTKLTVASDSLHEYKKLTGSKWFQRRFPILGDVVDSEIRRAYRGGFTYADERFKGRKVGGGLVLDVNSLYPSVMKEQMLPYGEPKFQDGRVILTDDYPLAIFSITFVAKLKPGHIPCIQIKGSSIFGATEYLKNISEPTTLMMTNIDFELYNDHYDLEVLEYGGGWLFRAERGMFDSYIDKWSEIKANSKGGKREIAKLHLNALYGKFASNPRVTGKYPILKDGAVHYVRGPEETRPPVYTAVGVFITSYARDLTIRAAQANYPVFAYADTDSLHLLTDTVPEAIEVHPTKLGAWKFEYDFDSAFYIRPKAYIERHHADPAEWCDECKKCVDCDYASNAKCDVHVIGCYTNRIAGLPEIVSSKLTFDDMVDGKILHGKLNPKSVPGGVVLNDVPFELKL